MKKNLCWFLLGLLVLVTIGATKSTFVNGLWMTSITPSRPLYINASGDITNASGTPDGTKFMRDDGVLAVPAGGGGSPAGNSGAVQFNEGGAFAGTNDLNFDRTNRNLGVNGNITITNKITQTGGGIGLDLSGALLLRGGNMIDGLSLLRMSMPSALSGAIYAFQFYGTNGQNIGLTIDKDGNGITASNLTVNGGGTGGVSLYDGAQTEYFRLESAYDVQTNNVLVGLSNATAGVLVARGSGTGTNRMYAVPEGVGMFTNGPTGIKGWMTIPSGGGATALSNLTDVAISNPFAGQVLMQFPDGMWRNTSVIFNNYYNVTVISNVTISVGTNAEQSYAIATSNSFGVTYLGTPLPGERIRYAINNTNLFVSINFTNPSYNPLVASNVLYYTIPTNSIASFTFVNRTNWNSAGTNRWELDGNIQKEMELLFGNGITASTNAQGTAVTLSAGALTGSMTQTNFVLNQVYTNSGTTPVLLHAQVFLSAAAVNGNCALDLMVSFAGGADWGKVDGASMSTLLTGVAVTVSNSISAVITNTGSYYFTNSSSGVGNSAGIFAGTGQITTLGGVQGATGADGASTTNFASIIVTNQVLFQKRHFASSAANTNQLDFNLRTHKGLTNAMTTNLVFQITNVLEGSSVKLFLYGSTVIASNYTATFTATNGVSLLWPNGITNGLFDVLIPSNSVVTIDLFADRTTNIVIRTVNIPALYGTVTGAGTDQALGTALAPVVFGTTSPNITLPDAGTWLITANLSVINSASLGSGDGINALLTNSTSGGALIGTGAFASWAAYAFARVNLRLSEVVTVDRPSVIGIYAVNQNAVRHTNVSGLTWIKYSKLP